MSHQITIQPSGHRFFAQPGETVLQAALREGFPLPYGCRNGACGTCKGKIIQGTVDFGSYNENALTETEKQAGMALFCRAVPLSELVIECREIGAIKDIKIKTLPCRVQKLERVAPDVMIISLKLPTNERLQFLAGQYIDILMKNGKRRSFSLANAPHDDELLQLHVRNYPGGAFAEHVFMQMKERDILRFEGPLGTFFLREDSDKPIIFVASGTGFAPVKSILEDVFHGPNPRGHERQIVLYWGNRTRADLYAPELAGSWQQEHDNFTFIPVLSEPLPSDNWNGRTGLVHQAVLEDFDDLSGYQVYACGTPPMVEAAHRDFTRLRGLPEEEFFSDAFITSATSASPPKA
ncbi:CDP-4-dehydro-6-deoxyglucose reductase [Nitrosospira multiformis ATCC 25196]|uniref:CDP-4-dehydro-6-deoxyglucose reductase n=1 Tax=Nitrosospira multiformis (strain ATCC 25196 / NCIMB 11849 / C 71) TaxID=323848 RepID=Q2Y5J8_NITMU|nr:CDP-6-deoxy-delta-3,4-glucoseen reductase [Nitrosospira multiformis]ABB75973.1 oxidoreductase FAD/NAD(P)-binding protein [Nitrosospira multiformis ATCC 25196]SEF79281.1 CDP-4-dehydro-6-deoxyglucose reductase [Nitrosospira multiformis ATCC 25196]